MMDNSECFLKQLYSMDMQGNCNWTWIFFSKLTSPFVNFPVLEEVIAMTPKIEIGNHSDAFLQSRAYVCVCVN